MDVVTLCWMLVFEEIEELTKASTSLDPCDSNGMVVRLSSDVHSTCSMHCKC